MNQKYLFIAGLVGLLYLSWWASCAEGQSSQDNAVPGGDYWTLTSEVEYTGRESCQPCHQEIYDSYLKTGMGRSLYRPRRDEIIERFGPEEVVADGYSGYSYHPYWSGDSLYILEFRLQNGDTTYQRRERIDYIVGSGHQTRSYLLERNQHYYEAPITWYVRSERWDLSPGYENGQNTRFDRAIGEECMACHTGHIDFEPGTMNLFREVSLGIDCEKCHGPGSVHIERKEAGELIDVGKFIDYTIVNPAKLPLKEQFDVCQQCHLQGVNVLRDGKSVTDFRPGMSLSEVYDIFIEQFKDEQSFGIASHAERLQQSRCFIASAGEMTCTTCHDPHESVGLTDPQVFVKQCQSCHTGGDLIDCGIDSEMMTANDGDCISCHMPKGGTSDIPHVAFSDHFIRVVDTSKARSAPGQTREFLQLVCMTDSQPHPDTRGKAYLLYFERVANQGNFLEMAQRDLSPTSHFERASALYYEGKYQSALQAIEKALAEQPNDNWRLFRKGEILEGMGDNLGALQTYQQVYANNPKLTEAGLKVGVLTLRTATEPTSALQNARQIFSDCLDRKPFDKRLLANMGFVEMNAGNFTEAEKLLNEALSYDPAYLLALENMIILQSQMQQKETGRSFLDQLIQFHPGYPKRGMMEEILS